MPKKCLLPEAEYFGFCRSTVGLSLGQVLVRKSSAVPLKANPKAREWGRGLLLEERCPILP